MDSSAAFTTAARSTGSSSSRIFPLTMRETSSRSSIRRPCATAFRSMMSSARRVAGSSCVRRRICAHPRTAFSGVRSSCDSVARNSSFTRLASSASWWARCASSNRCSRSRSVCDARSSARLCSVTSWSTARHMTGIRDVSRTSATRRSTSRTSPARVRYRRDAVYASQIPVTSLTNAVRASSSSAGSRNAENDTPFTSRSVYPELSRSARFASIILPCRSRLTMATGAACRSGGRTVEITRVVV